MDLIKHLRVDPDEKLKLSRRDPGDKLGLEDKEQGIEKLGERLEQLRDLQYRLFVEGKRSVLVVLQALDAGGKDGTIRKVFGPLNPQGTRVAAFKKPTEEELAHDFLWRIHKQAPAKGEVVVFNRSHYEDVLIVRVHDLVPKRVWSKRYDIINAFEKHLVEEAGTTILKFYLHISPEEQLERFKSRIDDPIKHWKLNVGDYDERAYWRDYTKAFEDALSKTSTPWAPWFVIPADRKWVRNVAVSTVVAETMKKMRLKMPEPAADLDVIRTRYEQALAEGV